MKALWIENGNQILVNDAVIFITVENAKESVYHIRSRLSSNFVMLKLDALRGEHDIDNAVGRRAMF